MTVLVDLTNGNVKYNLHDLVAAAGEGQAIEFDQFNNKLRADAGPPDPDLGSDDEFYLDTTGEILYYKINGAWESIGGGGGTALTVQGTADVNTINVSGGLTASTSSDDPAGTVNLRVDNPTFDTPTQNSGNVVVNVNPGNGSFTLPAATCTLAGVMIGTDKARLDDLNTYDLTCLLYTSPSPRDRQKSRMPSSA